MIPIKLALRNFMCYRSNVSPLYFESFHIACLSGDNGNGKSALLDAITWALWGKARARSDDDLIHLGQSEMDVEFDFAVGQNRYRVLRKRTRASLKRAGQSILDLQIATPDGFSTISGNSIRETESKIIELLRMDYDTFINSALLLQGRADEFSMKRPGERKEVLANILSLSVYDEFEKLSKNRSKANEIRQHQLADSLGQIEQQLQRKDEYQAELHKTQEAISAVSNQVKKQESILNDLRRSQEALKQSRERSGELGKQIEQSNQQLIYLNSRTDNHRTLIERYDKVLSSYEANLAQIRTKLDELDNMERDMKAKMPQIEELSNRIHYLHTTNTKLKEDMGELRQKLDLLGQGKAECPLCGTELGVEGQKRIMDNYETQGKEKGDTCRANLAEIQQKEVDLKTRKTQVTELETRIYQDRTKYQRQADALEREHTEAAKTLPLEREALDQAQKAITTLQIALKENTEKRNAILAEIETLPRVEDEFVQAEQSYRQLQDQERKYRDRLVELQAGLRRCTELETEKQGTTKALRLAVEEKGIYDELTTAFGKRGIQALIIERALPEIEEEANRLLGRMTDNRMHVRIESQRDTRKGETIETLDIKISDELGTRNYEMFSGGEAFRINFALRIALSRLLARRAGAPLPTLIVDEGFGTQDSTGKEKLVEAINSIQDEFEKIIVITHIEDLKDAFPVRIEVRKTDEGSTFFLN